MLVLSPGLETKHSETKSPPAGSLCSRTWKCLGTDMTRALPPEGPRRRHFHPLAPIAAFASPPAPPPSGVTAIIVTWADVRSRDRGMRETSHSEAPARVMAGTEAGDSSGRLAAAHPRDRERPPPPGSPTHHRGRRRRRGRTAEPVSIRSRGGGRAGGGAGAAPPGPRVPSLRRGRRRSRRSAQAAPAILWQRGEQGGRSSGAEPVLPSALTLALPAVFPCHLVAKCGIRQGYFKSGCSLM